MNTHITFVLDSSGSMAAIEEDTIGGYNTFLDKQRDGPGHATVTLYDFNTTVELVYEGKPIRIAPELTADKYSPSGRTALHDALHIGINDTEDLVNSMVPAQSPDQVIVVVFTDGKENASETPPDKLRELITTKREDDEWEFLFIGANQDAALTANEMGMDADKSLDMAHSGEGAEEAYHSTSEQINQARRTGSTEGYTDEDRRRQKDSEDS